MADEDCLEAPQGDYGGHWNDIWCNSNPYTEGYVCEFGPFVPADVDGDGYAVVDGDCDDLDPDTYPGAPELCDGIDNNCNNGLPPGETDGDGDGWMICDGDCNDTDAAINPGATELCDGIDNNCNNGMPPDEVDDDADGWMVCDGDCDDADPDTWPGAAELCDRADNDCDGVVPADEADDDADNWSICANDCDDADPAVHPNVAEDCFDGVDNDCDGDVDEDDDECAGDDDDTVGDDDDDDDTMGDDDDTDSETDWADDGSVCASLWGTDLGVVPTWTGTCDPNAGYEFYGSHCYYPVTSSANWPDARATCAAAGGYLATVADSGENAFLDSIHSRPHIGGCDADVEGTFTWITGETWSFENWAPNEPNNMSDEDCVEIYGGGIWNDIWCTSNPYTSGFVCEFGNVLADDLDGDGYAVADGDCDDGDPAIHPGAAEVCNGIDDDCDGTTDEGLAQPGSFPNCEERTHDGRSYFFCDIDVTWQTASNTCAAGDTHLVTIDDYDEDLFVYDQILQIHAAKWWIGMWDPTETCNFIWEHPQATPYTNWMANEPSCGVEYCVHTYYEGDHVWNDEVCWSTKPYVCEADCS